MVLRILANENVPGEAIDALRILGHDVVWMRTHAPGSPDEAVLKLAQVDNRLSGPAHTTALIVAALQSRLEWAGYFSVVENDRIRMVPLRRFRDNHN